jgi:hypothetical protein
MKNVAKKSWDVRYLIDRFRKTYNHILIFIFLLLQEKMSARSMSYERPSKALKSDIKTFQSEVVFCRHINKFCRVFKLMKHSVRSDYYLEILTKSQQANGSSSFLHMDNFRLRTEYVRGLDNELCDVQERKKAGKKIKG